MKSVYYIERDNKVINIFESNTFVYNYIEGTIELKCAGYTCVVFFSEGIIHKLQCVLRLESGSEPVMGIQ